MNEAIERYVLAMTIYAVFLLIAWPICGRLIYCEMQGSWPSTDKRGDIGASVVCGLLLGTLGPLGIFIAFLLSGMAKHGFFKARI